jgi:hypothetical protein
MQQRKAIRLVTEFLTKRLGELGDIRITTGEDGVKYSEYAREGRAWVCFESSPMYYHMNDPQMDRFAFMNEFDAFMKDNGLWYERGYAWDLTVLDERD